MAGIELVRVQTVTLDERWHRISRDLPSFFDNERETHLEDEIMRLEGVGSVFCQNRRLMVRIDDEKAIPQVLAVVERNLNPSAALN